MRRCIFSLLASRFSLLLRLDQRSGLTVRRVHPGVATDT
jgi:hypothetical protein